MPQKRARETRKVRCSIRPCPKGLAPFAMTRSCDPMGDLVVRTRTNTAFPKVLARSFSTRSRTDTGLSALDVQIQFTGSYPKDFAAADKAAGITKKMRDDEGYTWHHHQDGKTMQLIKESVHKDFFHTGGMARARKEYGKCE